MDEEHKTAEVDVDGKEVFTQKVGFQVGDTTRQARRTALRFVFLRHRHSRSRSPTHLVVAIAWLDLCVSRACIWHLV